jgi:antirestriction protein ArdC
MTEDILVSDLITLMESSDLPPWRRDWRGASGPHRNLATGQPYRGSNPILLELGSILRGHNMPLWIGGAQAKASGWFPRKGCKSVRIVRPQTNQREEAGENGADPVIRTWTSYKGVPVFNAADLVGGTEAASAELAAAISKALGTDGPKPTHQRLDRAETVLESWTVPTVFGGSRACYSPAADQISMPEPDDFETREGFCATWAHEQVHSTGHADRLARSFGRADYAREELIAELGSVLVCYRLQIGYNLANHAAYMASWATMLREDAKVLYKVLSEARKAADLIVAE